MSRQREFSRNQAMQVVRFLEQTHSFEACSSVEIPAYGCVIDDQHSKIVYVSSRLYSTRGDSADSYEIMFGLARRDINEHWLAWDDEPRSWDRSWWGISSAMERGTAQFFTPRRLEWGKSVPFEDAVEEIDDAVRRLDSYANLEFIEEWLYEYAMPAPFLVAVNDALNGDDRGAEQFRRLLERTQQKPADHPSRLRVGGFEEKLLAFREAHPDGIARL